MGENGKAHVSNDFLRRTIAEPFCHIAVILGVLVSHVLWGGNHCMAERQHKDFGVCCRRQ